MSVCALMSFRLHSNCSKYFFIKTKSTLVLHSVRRHAGLWMTIMCFRMCLYSRGSFVCITIHSRSHPCSNFIPFVLFLLKASKHAQTCICCFLDKPFNSASKRVLQIASLSCFIFRRTLFRMLMLRLCLQICLYVFYHLVWHISTHLACTRPFVGYLI